MKIDALRLFNVKRFANRGVAIEGIGDGVNVLCAANEFGKSTSFEALHALFFQPHTGTPGDVQRLRPYGGGNPMIEADISTDKGRYRLTKQFYGGRRATVTELPGGRMVAQADEAENFIAGLIKGGTAGPAGLLWVRQGITGIERRSKTEEDSEKRVRESLLSSVQGEVEAVTGGRRMSDVLAACSEELALLVTPGGKPKAGGAYAAALEERTRLEAEEKRLSAEVLALRTALDQRTAAQKRLSELDEEAEKTERRAAVERAEALFEAAKAHGEALKAAEAELGLARERRNAATRERDTFRDAAAKAEKLQGDLEAASRQRDAARARRQEATQAVETAIAAAEAAEAEERAARELLARLDATMKAREAAGQHALLKQRLDEAEAARAELEAGEAALALLAVPPKSVDRLQALEIEIVRLRASEAASLPTLSLEYETTSTPRVALDGIALEHGEERPFGDAARLDLPGIGRLTLRARRPATDDGALRKAEAERHSLLSGLGVADLAQARRRQAEAQARAAALDRLRDRIGLLAPDGLAALRAAVLRHEATDDASLELKGDPAQVRAALDAAGRKVNDNRNAVREVQPLRSKAQDALVEAETLIATVGAELAQLDATLGPKQERTARLEALDAAAAGHDAAFAAAEARAGALCAAAPDLDSAQAALSRARSAEEAANAEAAQLRERIAELNGQIRTRADEAVEEAWRETADALSAATARAADFAREVAVLERLRAALEAARTEARDLYLKPVMTELRPLLGLLFDDVSIVFDEKTLLPDKILRDGQEEEVERLSGGMREQLSVLTRLAFARLLARDGRPAPVILDDALVYSDDDRIERMFDALHRQSRDQQIIVFSCRQRAFARLGGNVLQMTDWRPAAD
jgi:DNA repair exonuclease SbcCD ATPase subunit